MSQIRPTPLELNRLFSDLKKGGQRADGAVGALYDIFAKRFVGLLRTHGLSTSDAEEVVQEVFLKVMQNADKLARAKLPTAYLYRILRNCEIDWRRKETRTMSQSIDDLKSTPSQLRVDLVDADGFLDCLQSVLGTIGQTEPDRALVIRAAIIEQFTRHEVAEMLGRTYAATRQFLYEARKRFLELLREHCGDYLRT